MTIPKPDVGPSFLKSAKSSLGSTPKVLNKALETRVSSLGGWLKVAQRA